MEYKRPVSYRRMRSKASQMFLATLPLQSEIQSYYGEIRLLLDAEESPAKDLSIRDLEDEIFACRIEIQTLQKQAYRLVRRAHYLEFSGNF